MVLGAISRWRFVLVRCVPTLNTAVGRYIWWQRELSRVVMPGDAMSSDSGSGSPVLVPPQPKSDTVTMAEYIDYFEAVARANSWDDATQAKIFPALLGVGNKALTDCPEADRALFSRMKTFLTRVSEPYRDAHMLDLLRANMRTGESVEQFRDRIVSLVEQVYPRFAAANKATLSRDFFVCGIREPLRSAVLNAGTSRKLEDVVNTALMCQSLHGRLSHVPSGGAAATMPSADSSRRGPAVDGSPGPRSAAGPVCWCCGGRGHVIARCSRARGGRPRQVEGLSSRPRDGRLYLDTEIDGQRIQLLVDSGATVSCLPAMFSPQEPASEQCITAANGTKLQVFGIYRASVRMEDQVQQHTFFITDVRQGVMGMDLLQKFGAQIDIQHGEVRPSARSSVQPSGGGGGNCGPSGRPQVLPPSGGAVNQQSRQLPRPAGGALDVGGASSHQAGLLTAAVPDEPDDFNTVLVEDEFINFAQIAMVDADDLMSECESGADDNSGSCERLNELLSEFDDVFNGLGRTQLIEHKIETTSDVPIVGRQYRLPVAYKDKAQTVIDQMIRDGVVEPSDSDYMNPVVLVKKKGSDIPRVCIDFRALNSVTVKDRQPVPRVEDAIRKLASARVFSLVDAKQGYYQIPLRQEDRKKTAFQFNGQLLQFTVLPFGLCNGPSTYNRLMHRITKDLTCVSAYFDDWCVFSSNESEHISHLRVVLERLRSAGLTLNRDKCRFMTSSLDSFLGFSISQGSVRPTEEHVRAIEAVKRPSNQKELKRFLGLCGFYRAHVPHFSLIARPLHDLLKKSSTFTWDGAHESAFLRLRETLMSRPVLTIPTETTQFTVRTAANQAGITVCRKTTFCRGS